jgi:hypothetical protein
MSEAKLPNICPFVCDAVCVPEPLVTLFTSVLITSETLRSLSELKSGSVFGIAGSNMSCDIDWQRDGEGYITKGSIVQINCLDAFLRQ